MNKLSTNNKMVLGIGFLILAAVITILILSGNSFVSIFSGNLDINTSVHISNVTDPTMVNVGRIIILALFVAVIAYIVLVIRGLIISLKNITSIKGIISLLGYIGILASGFISIRLFGISIWLNIASIVLLIIGMPKRVQE